MQTEMTPASQNFFIKHLRGEYSLARSYWVNTCLISALAPALATAVLPWFAENYSSRVASSASLLAVVFIYGMWLWAISGTWASANRHERRGGRPVWASAAKILIVLGVINAGSTLVRMGPGLSEHLSVALGQQFGPETRFELRADGKSLLLQGGINDGSADALVAALKLAPHVQTVVLQSGGGWLRQGRLLADVIRSRGLNTYVEGECTSACTIAFLAGKERTADPRAKLGFHAARAVGGGTSDRSFKTAYEQATLPAPFIAKALSTPNSRVWYPTRSELLAAGVLTRDSAGGETAAIATAMATRESVVAAMRKEALFEALAEKYPAEFDQIIDAMWKGIQDRQEDRVLFAAARTRVHRITRRLVHLASDPVLLQLNQVVQQEAQALAAAGHPEVCAALTFGPNDDAQGLQRWLPQPLVRRELDTLAAVVRTSSEANAVVPAVEQVRAHLQYALQGLTPEDLQVVQTGSAAGFDADRACRAGIAFYNAVNDMPEPGRRIVLRAIYSRM